MKRRSPGSRPMKSKNRVPPLYKEDWAKKFENKMRSEWKKSHNDVKKDQTLKPK